MKKEMQLTFIITLITILFGIGFLIITKVQPSEGLLSPFGNSRNIVSLFRGKKERPKSIIYGYLPYWTIEKGKYLQYDKLTDIAYFGLYIDEEGGFQKLDEEGYYLPGYNKWRQSEELKKVIKEAKENDVRVALTVISHTDEISDKFLACRSCWDTFMNNLIKELDYHDIYDVNLNFEYVEYTEDGQEKLYTEFVRYVNKRLDEEYNESFVVVSTFADSLIKQRISSEISELAKVSDGIFIMAYDFHRPTSDNAGPVSPIDGIGIHAEYDIRTMLEDYLTEAPPNKLIMGVPYYGYNWVVENDEEYAERIQGSDELGYSQSQAYEDIMETILKINPDIMWDDLGLSPYFTYTSPETQQFREVYYENERSLSEKYSIIKENNLAGVGIWALGYDGGYIELWDLLYEYFVKE